jgi:hypothetical protein
MGFDQAGLDDALRTHLTTNFGNASSSGSMVGGGSKFSVRRPMTGPSGQTWDITTAWGVARMSWVSRSAGGSNSTAPSASRRSRCVTWSPCAATQRNSGMRAPPPSPRGRCARSSGGSRGGTREFAGDLLDDGDELFDRLSEDNTARRQAEQDEVRGGRLRAGPRGLAAQGLRDRDRHVQRDRPGARRGGAARVGAGPARLRARGDGRQRLSRPVEVGRRRPADRARQGEPAAPATALTAGRASRPDPGRVGRSDAGSVRASYGYDAYGGQEAPDSDTQSLTTGDPDNPSAAPRTAGSTPARARISSGTTPSTGPARSPTSRPRPRPRPAPRPAATWSRTRPSSPTRSRPPTSRTSTPATTAAPPAAPSSTSSPSSALAAPRRLGRRHERPAAPPELPRRPFPHSCTAAARHPPRT